MPARLRVHDVFHVSLLKPFHGTAEPLPLPELVDGEEKFEVESILAHREKKAGRGRGSRTHIEYLVQWKGYGPEHHSWEPATHLSNSPVCVQAYWDAVKLRDMQLQSAADRAAELSDNPAPRVRPRPQGGSGRSNQTRKRRRRHA